MLFLRHRLHYGHFDLGEVGDGRGAVGEASRTGVSACILSFRIQGVFSSEVRGFNASLYVVTSLALSVALWLKHKGYIYTNTVLYRNFFHVILHSSDSMATTRNQSDSHTSHPNTKDNRSVDHHL
jgi:hypothetical protein